MSTLADLEARIAALEANQADYRAVLAAVNALGANQREQVGQLREHGRQLRELQDGQTRLQAGHDDTNARVRSIEESVAEIKDLLVRALDR